MFVFVLRKLLIIYFFLDSKLIDLITNRLQKTVPVDVAKFWDDLLLGVKGQSRLVIASSPWNVFKYSVFYKLKSIVIL